MGMTDDLVEHAKIRPDHPAIEDMRARRKVIPGGRVVSYADLPKLVDNAAANLLESGVQAQDFVGIMLPGSADHIIARLALERIGAVIIPIRRSVPDREKRAAIDDLDVKAVISNRRYLETVPPGPRRLSIDDVCAIGGAGERVGPIPAIPMDDRPLIASKTSGTTGDPKRLIQSRKHLWERSRIFNGAMLLTPKDRYLLLPGLDYLHCYELVRAMFSLGGTVVVGYPMRGNADYLSHFGKRDITLVCMAPSHLQDMLRPMKDTTPRFPNLAVALTGAPVTSDLRSLSCAKLTSKIINWYGSSEVGGVALATQFDHEKVPDSVGRGLDGVDVQVVGDDGEALPPMEIGQIGYRAPYFPTEYHNNPEATAKYFRDGWFFPGDFAAISEDGYIFVMGRADDAINHMGENFFPFETERVLRSHPAVVDAAVFGLNHPIHGELPVAAVVVREIVTPEALDTFCEEQLAVHKQPRWIVLVPDLPKNAGGKVVKSRLQKMIQPQL